MRLIVASGYIEVLRDAVAMPGQRQIVFPSGVPVHPLENAVDFVLIEGLSYYETELAFLDERIRGLRAREVALADRVQYDHDPRTGEPVPIGPRVYLATLDALAGCSALQRSLARALDELRSRGAEEVRRLIAEFKLVANNENLAEPIDVKIELRRGYTSEPTLGLRLAGRKAKRDPFAQSEQRANEAVFFPERVALRVPGQHDDIGRVTYRKPTGELVEVTE